MRATLALLISVATALTAQAGPSHWPVAKAPLVPEADGYVAISNAAVSPAKSHLYHAIFDATRAADDPAHLVPALNMAGSELNAFGVTGVPLGNVKLVVVFHGQAIDGILTDSNYKAKFGVSNPNLKALTEMKKLGVEFFVCGQNLAVAGIDPKTLSTDVTVASDALIVLMTYQIGGFAVLNF